jgi:DegV family protein with EDD domain
MESDMAAVRVVCDSSCDLPASALAEWRIEIVPLTIRFGDEEFVDREDLTPQEFWARCKTSPLLPETSAPSPGAFEKKFRELKADGADGVVVVTLSSKLSATEQAARLGAKALEGELPVNVVDSLSATLGQGMIGLAAARAGAEGKSLDEVTRIAEELVPRTRLYGALDTLENLKKGGRIGNAQALLGSMLSLKPIVELQNGTVEAGAKVRTRSRALRYLVDQVRNNPGLENLAVLHGDAPDLDEFLTMLDSFYPRDQIVIGDLGAVIGAHAGPRTIGVVFQVPG